MSKTWINRNAFFTIDTDNAIIRFYRNRAVLANLSKDDIIALHRDLRTLATGVSHVASCEFRVVIVDD